ncbi:1,4-beta-D-glucan cellobiohydrolase CEL6C [Colletotrichum spaethianum]|uniref:Glucanase n=1 Tax=Colletotrichum spaethianum TaxID=700344 RepID=A0AA37PG14_9PEZI|nr:1,4-beta-D-glucan cellobiohydrolase CEL6C [Colletotrichum spaethianum]GKT51385.1 1,4-beta-D-glucan cellobiohydrolase CEL6C [Colletotrichum spaethianum]
MKFTAATLAALASTAIAAPSTTFKEQPRQAASACSTNVSLDAKTNVFSKYTLHDNSFYRKEVQAAAANISDGSLKAKALKVADVGTFLWVDSIANIQRLEPAISDVPCNHILGVVIYDLPGRDCAAKASNGELRVGELNRYKTEYIDPIVKILKAHPKTAFALIIEPDSLPNLVTNINLQTCQDSASSYRDGVAYALKNLNLPNVVMFIDAGHGGWLGWNDNVTPGAQELAKAYKAAGSPSQVRGIATNVAGWNSWDAEPGEFANAPDGQYNKAQNEKKYVTIFGNALKTAGMPNHAIVDTGRNGVQGIRQEWGDWCNVNGAGFGLRPSGSTGLELADAFVWVKPGGESDGTSDSTATRYDSFCGKSDAYKPSPEAGTWNQAYFEMLLKNAKPPF